MKSVWYEGKATGLVTQRYQVQIQLGRKKKKKNEPSILMKEKLPNKEKWSMHKEYQPTLNISFFKWTHFWMTLTQFVYNYIVQVQQ